MSREAVRREVLAVFYRWSQESDTTVADVCAACVDAIGTLCAELNEAAARNAVDHGVPEELVAKAQEVERAMMQRGIIALMGLHLASHSKLKGGGM